MGQTDLDEGAQRGSGPGPSAGGPAGGGPDGARPAGGSPFEHSPFATIVYDLSALRAHLDDLRDGGVDDFAAHFAAHPVEAGRCGSLVRMLEANASALSLFGAASRQGLVDGLDLGIHHHAQFDAGDQQD